MLVPSPLRLKIRGEIRVIFGAKGRVEEDGKRGDGFDRLPRWGERVDRMSEGSNGKSNLSGKITLSTASEDWTGGKGGISGETHLGGKRTDGHGRPRTAVTTNERSGRLKESGRWSTGGKRLGDGLGDSQPRFADGKGRANSDRN